jgi:hypothetical protein
MIICKQEVPDHDIKLLFDGQTERSSSKKLSSATSAFKITTSSRSSRLSSCLYTASEKFEGATKIKNWTIFWRRARTYFTSLCNLETLERKGQIKIHSWLYKIIICQYAWGSIKTESEPSQASCFSSTHEFKDNEESGISLSLSTYFRYNSLFTPSQHGCSIYYCYITPLPPGLPFVGNSRLQRARQSGRRGGHVIINIRVSFVSQFSGMERSTVAHWWSSTRGISQKFLESMKFTWGK